MTTVEGAWSREELETFLDEALVPLRLGCHTTRDRLWMLSLWFQYDGQFRCATGDSSDVAAFLRKDSEVAFEVSTNRPPYMGVRGNGTATLEPDEQKETLRALLDRYLGGPDSELAQLLLDDDRDELTLTIEPDRLYTWDFSGRMDGALSRSPAVQQDGITSPRHGTPDSSD